MTESRRKSRGFSLLEIAMVLAILGFVLTIGLKSTGAYLSAERRQTTVARLAGVDAALVNYVALQKRLPCPADGASTQGAALLGVERRDNVTGLCSIDPGPPATPFMNRGVVPWVTLGISEAEAQDGWGNRITYRTSISPGVALTIDKKMDMTLCDPAGTDALPLPGLRPTPTCTATTPPLNYLWGAGRGLEVRDDSGVAGVKLMEPFPAIVAPAVVPPAPTGAAYVLISHGENRGGGYSSSGVIQTGSPANSALENINNNNQAIQLFYVDAPQVDAAGPNHFDDIVVRPTIMSVVTRAGLGPRKP